MATSTRSSAVPAPLTSFVGRETELTQIADLLNDARLVTLSGIGGAGKTRLALEVAERSGAGVTFVDLVPVNDDAGVVRSFATAIGIAATVELSARDDDETDGILAAAASEIGDREMLVVFDNCELVVPAVARVVSVVLARCPRVRVLVTSREVLSVAGESVFRVPPLDATVPASMNVDSLAVLARTDAIKLFCERARAVREGFELTDSVAPAVVDICQRLDGLPLAIELAAARMNALSPSDIAERIRGSNALLRSSRTAEERHQTMQAVLEWSYRSLEPDEQVLLRRLSVFTGGWNLASAEAVCGQPPLAGEMLLEIMTRLVDKSFVVPMDVDGASRFRFLEPMRQFLDSQLDASERDETRRRHRDWFMTQVRPEEMMPMWPEPYVLIPDIDNFRSALRWSIERGERTESLRLAIPLGELVNFLDRPVEQEEWLKEALGTGDEDVSSLTATALSIVALCEMRRTSIPLAKELGERAIRMFEEVGDDAGRALAYERLALTLSLGGDRVEAQGLRDRATELASARGDVYTESVVAINRAFLDLVHGETQGYREQAERAANDPRLAPLVKNAFDVGLTICMVAEGDIEQGIAEYERAVEKIVYVGEDAIGMMAAVGLLDERSRPHALGLLAGTIARCSKMARTANLCVLLECAALAAFFVRRFGDVLTLAAGAMKMRDTTGVRLTYTPLIAPLSAALEATREAVGDNRADAYAAMGARMSLDELAALGLAAIREDSVPRAERVEHQIDGASCRLMGDFREVRFGGRTFQLRESRGLAYLARLLAAPGREFHVLDLSSADAPPEMRRALAVDAGAVLDDEAKQAYRRRLADLEVELEEAESWNDGARAVRIADEMEALKQEITSAVGLGGRDVRAGSAVQRARSAVTKAIRSAIERIASNDASLGEHLTSTIKTGVYCAYTPDTRVPIEWEV